jgi:hypothetical protein
MHIGCGSTTYFIRTVYRGTGHLYTSGVCPALLVTPYLTSLATPCCPGRPDCPDRPDRPDRPVDGAQLATPQLATPS